MIAVPLYRIRVPVAVLYVGDGAVIFSGVLLWRRWRRRQELDLRKKLRLLGIFIGGIGIALILSFDSSFGLIIIYVAFGLSVLPILAASITLIRPRKDQK